jgi:hypothetical protein
MVPAIGSLTRANIYVPLLVFYVGLIREGMIIDVGGAGDLLPCRDKRSIHGVADVTTSVSIAICLVGIGDIGAVVVSIHEPVAVPINVLAWHESMQDS